MDEEEKKPINIELTEQITDPKMIKMLLILNDQMYKKMRRRILLLLSSLKIKKVKWWGNLFKKIT